MHIYREEEIHAADANAAKNGLSVNALMETAGRSLFYAMRQYVRQTDRILVLCGRGNNGGDGIVLARYFRQFGYDAELVFPFGLPKAEAAAEHFRYYRNLHFPYGTTWEKDGRYDVIVDAMLGVGTKLPLKKDVAEVLSWCNAQNALRLAVDLPTGVTADSGEAEEAFRADITFTLHGYKPSAFLYPSGKYYGKISVLDIGLPHSSKWRVWGREDVRRTLKRRDPFSHKGSFGTGLLVAGSDEMPGCAILAGSAAMRVGIGKLMIGTTKYAASIVSPRLPEATYWQINHQSGEALRLPEGVDAVAVGPGIADADFIERFLTEIWPKEIPLVLDAGALQPRNWTKRKAPTVITPHPGEMARLTGLMVEEIQRNRIKVASDFAVRNGMIVVLKGKDTVIALPDGTGFVNLTGNPGLAKGGSGDALTGMILGLVASEPDPVAAVANAVYLHGLCADELLKEESERAIMAGEISATIGRVLRSLAETEENGSY